MSADIDLDLADRNILLNLIQATPARQQHQGPGALRGAPA